MVRRHAARVGEVPGGGRRPAAGYVCGSHPHLLPDYAESEEAALRQQDAQARLRDPGPGRAVPGGTLRAHRPGRTRRGALVPRTGLGPLGCALRRPAVAGARGDRRRGGAALGQTRYIEVRYEDLLEDAARELERLCAFIDLPYIDAMLDYQRREKERALGRDPHHHLWKPPTKGLRIGARGCRARHPAVRVIAGESLTAFGYERRASRPRCAIAPVFGRVAAAGARTKAERLKAAAASRIRRTDRSRGLRHA